MRHADNTSFRQFLRNHWHMVTVLIAFLATLLMVPFRANVPVGDDWVYARSVEILMQDGRVELLDLSVVTQIVQIFWGGIFTEIFGMTFWSMRLSTFVSTLLSGIAIYGMAREVGVRNNRAALGVALCLFNPLTFVLAFTFMTDPLFGAIYAFSVWFYLRGVRSTSLRARDLWIGSAFAALAFLVRQQGLLIPLAVGCYLFLARRWKFNEQGLYTAIRVAGVPLVSAIGFYVWLWSSHGVPEQQSDFAQQVIDGGWSTMRTLVYRLSVFNLVYAGFFALPVLIAVCRWYFGDRGTRTVRVRYVVLLSVLVLAATMIAYGSADRLFPQLAQYFSLQGLGPNDLTGPRSPLMPDLARRLISFVVYLATALLLMLLVRKVRIDSIPARIWLLLSVGFWQFVGMLPPSVHFATWSTSLDRYLMPLIPVVVVLALWAVERVELSVPVAWLAIAAIALFSIGGTRDFLVHQQAVWDISQEAIDQGIRYDQLDGGAGWDGYYLYQSSMDAGYTSKSVLGAQWWLPLFAPGLTVEYQVASSIPENFEGEVVLEREYSSWLHTEPQMLYLLKLPPPDSDEESS